MKNASTPLSKLKSKKTEQKTSGETSNKPRAITKYSRKDKDVPADRGAYEKTSSTQGSE
jgi:hypothetical protein